MPGQALIDLQMETWEEGRIELRVISRFLPKGLGGLFYWYILYPFHVWIFRGMLTAIARRAEASTSSHPQRFDPNAQTACAWSGSSRLS